MKTLDVEALSLDQRYRFADELGRGGFGVVYRATAVDGGEDVAIKLFAPRDGANNELSQRLFNRGAMLAKQLDAPGFVEVRQVGEDLERGPYMVMECLEGETLRSRLAREPLTVSESILLAYTLAEILVGAHSQGVVHRDLKPCNLMLVGPQQDELRVLDLGIATLSAEWRSESFETLTQYSCFVGSPCYLAPECVPGHDPHGLKASPRVDVYAWGLILLECLTGETAVQGNNVLKILAEQVRPRPVPIPEVWVESKLGPLLRHALAKDPQQRLASAVELVERLRPLMGDLSWIPEVGRPGCVGRVDEETLPPMSE